MKRLGDAANWAVLALVLALPAGAYRTWQAGQAAKRRAALAASQAVPAGEAFPDPAATVVTQEAEGAPAAGPPAVQDAVGAEAEPAPAAAPAAAVQASTAPAGLFEPKSDRDPMQSFEEKELLRRMAADDRMRREIERSQRDRARQRKAQPSAEDRIVLEGIVGNMAIVNGEAVRRGQTVFGAKVIKITADSVTFSLKGKTFIKKLRR